jgi:hypothetical protein
MFANFRRWSIRSWPAFGKALNRVLLALLGLCLPAAAQEQANGAGGLCQTMAPQVVMAVSGGIFFGIFLILGLIYWRLQHGGWSLANAASEPTTLRIPLDENWSQSLGDRKSYKGMGTPIGPVVSLTVMEASSSRLIALVGMVAILFIYVGFGIFSLYTYGLTCQMPASAVAVTTFLYSGLTLFAPYVANKVLGLLQPLRPNQPLPPEPAPAIPNQTFAPALPQPQPQLPPVSLAALGEAATVSRLTSKTATVTPLHRTAAASVKTAVAAAEPATVRALPPSSPNEASSYGVAVQLIAQFEGFVGHAYPDPASGAEPWTIGYGFTSLDGRPVQPGDTISRAEGDAQLLSGVNGCARHLAGKIPYWGSMAEDQRCALISFAWNLGEDFYGSDGFETISRQLREKDWMGVPGGLLLYCDPGTAVSDGLLRRRQAEANLWQKGLSQANVPAIPLAVASATAITAANKAVGTGASKNNPLNVPWYDQLSMDDGQGWRDCFSASSAMLAAYWGKEPNEDDYNSLREHYGDSTSAEAQLAALRHLGLTAEFRTDGTLQTLKSEIDAGRPVAVGW